MNNSSNNTFVTPPIGRISFTPLYAPNAVFLSIFVILLSTHAIMSVLFYRFYGYAIGMIGGLLLEMLGYVAKVQLAKSTGNKNAYIMYIIGLTLGPTFLSSSLYLGISALQRHYQTTCFRPVGPRLFATLFILGDFICLSFIGVGGSLAAIYAENPIGIDLMIAGLATQVLFTAIFCTLLTILYRNLRETLYYDSRKWYMLGGAVAAACLFIRSCWRAAELSGGFNGPLASKEGIFIALDSIPMILMSLLLTFLHPRLWFGHKQNKIRQLSSRSIEAEDTESYELQMSRKPENRFNQYERGSVFPGPGRKAQDFWNHGDGVAVSR